MYMYSFHHQGGSSNSTKKKSYTVRFLLCRDLGSPRQTGQVNCVEIKLTELKNPTKVR